jgi:hypothetical protein
MKTVTLLLLCLLLPACSRYQTSTRVAAHSIELLTKYETEIDHKIKAENNYTHRQLENMQQILGTAPLLELDAANQLTYPDNIFESKIITDLQLSATERSSRLAAQLITGAAPLSQDSIITHLRETDLAALTTFAQAERTNLELLTQTQDNLKKLTIRKQKLQDVRRNLIVLQTEPDLTERLQVAYQVAQETRKYLDEQEKKE